MIGNIKRVLIVGGGTAGWMTAAGLARKLGDRVQSIRLVESAEIGTVGVGEATLTHLRYFNQALGIDERTFMRETQATFKLGIEFINWGQIGDRYIHPFGDYGRPMRAVDFHHYWLRARAAGDQTPIDAYSFPIAAAQQNRFILPSPDPRSVLSTFSYAFQLDAGLYAAYLRRYSEARGVERIEGKIVDAALDPETGYVTGVALEDGRRLEADLFIDCSGFRGLLIEQALKTGYDDWSRWLPCNRAFAVPCESNDDFTPYTRATAEKAGWRWRIPLQHRLGNGHVYSNDFISDDDALGALMANLDGAAQKEPKQLFFLTGKRKRIWNRNVVSIGLSSGFLEPLESTSIYLIQIGITNLLELFPDRSFNDHDRDEYNAMMDLEYDRIRDFLVLHYIATEREDSEFWRYFRNLTLPDSLQYKLDLFRERGVVVKYGTGLFLEPSWLAVYLGQRITPKRYDPLADQMEDGEVVQNLAELRDLMTRAAAKSPDHRAFIDDYCRIDEGARSAKVHLS